MLVPQYLPPDQAVVSKAASDEFERKYETKLWGHLDIQASSEQPCRAYFERLAEQSPARLLELLDDTALVPADLTFAAEIAGQRLPHDIAIRNRLLELLQKSDSSLVREGVIYGLSANLTDDVCERLRSIAQDDPSPGVREAAKEALEG